MNFKTRKNTLLTGLTAFLFAVALCLSPSALHAQTSQNHHATAQHQRARHTFSGKIMQLKNGHFALIMGHGPHGRPEGHFLSNAKNAKKYVGKQVKVTGKLNMSDNTVKVSSIQPK